LALCQSIIKLVEMRNTLKEMGAVKWEWPANGV
jgi:hypothetical protein